MPIFCDYFWNKLQLKLMQIITYVLEISFHFIVSVTEISGLPNPAIWIGIDDKRREGDFRYYSNSAPAPIEGGPMGRNQPNGTRSENCLTSFPEDPRGPKRGSKWWNRHPKWWDRPCSDKKLVGFVLFIG